MPKIYELYGYPINDTSSTVERSRKKAYCPFLSATCDGGGNRHMSDVSLAQHPELKNYFDKSAGESVPSGICSLQLSDAQDPWIICPRRLLYMGKHANDQILHDSTQRQLIDKCNFAAGTTIGIWAETKIKYQDMNSDSEVANFDYTFDYVLMQLGQVTAEQAADAAGVSWPVLKRSLLANEYTFSQRNSVEMVDDFPVGNPVIVEVMTSSTSGGNKNKRTCIPQAFEDCLLGREHNAPGINYRQVWARMASQLIVKSQVALAWQGKTIWALQDHLVDYISSSTALNLHQFAAQHLSQVNILAFSYGLKRNGAKAGMPVELKDAQLYSGPISSHDSKSAKPAFQDIIKIAVCPPKTRLIASLAAKKITNRLH